MSCRSFLDEPVDPAVLDRVVSAANRSPSYMNSQPWEVCILKGGEKDALARKLLARAEAGAPATPDLPFPKDWPKAVKRRIEENRTAKLASEGIDLEDEDRIRQRYLRNFVFFKAPCVMLIWMPRGLTAWSVFDLGLFVQAVLLGLTSEGLRCCPQALPTAYPDVFRSELGLSEDLSLILDIAIGYPDLDASSNRFRSGRKTSSEFLRRYGY